MNGEETVTPDELVQRALRRRVAGLTDELHMAIEDGLTVDTLHSIVGLWEANNNNEELTYESLVEDGKPTACDDCTLDVTPFDEDGRPIEGAWEWYLVRDEIWKAASGNREPPRILCVHCLEQRIGRRLIPGDFADLPINAPGVLDSERLRDRLGVSWRSRPAEG